VRCPKCANVEDKVVETRISKDGDIIRRRRQCLECGHRFNTHEAIVLNEFVVIKRDGTREEFDTVTLRRGIQHATWKRQVTEEQIDQLVNHITSSLIKRADREVTTRVIGELVMERLKELDEVAYVRFASVYRSFKDVDEFINEVQNLAETQNNASLEQDEV